MLCSCKEVPEKTNLLAWQWSEVLLQPDSMLCQTRKSCARQCWWRLSNQHWLRWKEVWLWQFLSVIVFNMKLEKNTKKSSVIPENSFILRAVSPTLYFSFKPSFCQNVGKSTLDSFKVVNFFFLSLLRPCLYGNFVQFSRLTYCLRCCCMSSDKLSVK